MPAIQLTTWSDLLDHLVDWCGANPAAEVRRDARRASLNAMRDFSTAARWSYYYQLGRIVTSAPYSTGTVEYDHTGGSSERLMTLTDGVWPSWAALGSVVIDNVRYDVATRLSDTTVTLASSTNPGADVAAGESYTLIRDTYPMPINLNSIGMLILVGRSIVLEMDHPNTWLERQRIFHGVSEPRTYTITGSPDHVSGMALRLWPPPDDAHQMDLVYMRHPRQLKVDLVNAGKASLSSGSAAVTGSGATAWSSRLVGSVFRVGVDPTKPATGWVGENPPQAERIVTAVSSTTQLTLDETVSFTAGSAYYSISDPVDVEPGAMLTGLLRCCEHQMSQARHMKDRAEVQRDYNAALILAREADSRYFRDEASGQGGGVQRLPLRYMPQNG